MTASTLEAPGVFAAAPGFNPFHDYERPLIVEDVGDDAQTVDLVWLVFFIPAYLAALYYGGSWGYCSAVCGWGHVSRCENSWGRIKAVCWR